MGKFSGKVALITGSTEGIGFAIARRLALDGAHVVICSRRQENVDKALKLLKDEKLSASGIPCHVANAAARKSLLEKIKREQGGIDILVCNAAVNPSTGKVVDTSESVYDKIFDVNVKSVFFLIKESLPLMEGRKSPSIVTVSSWAGVHTGRNMAGFYSISKTALIALNKAMTHELAAKNIRINCIAPGYIRTNFSTVLEDLIPRIKKTSALKRLGEPEECAGAVSYFCSDDASYVTGETMLISGGLPSRL